MNEKWKKDFLFALIPIVFSLGEIAYFELRDSRTVILSNPIPVNENEYSQSFFIVNDSKEPLENIRFRLKNGNVKSIFLNDLNDNVIIDSIGILVPILYDRDSLIFSAQIESFQVPFFLLENKEKNKFNLYTASDCFKKLKVNWLSHLISGVISFVLLFTLFRFFSSTLDKKIQRDMEIKKALEEKVSTLEVKVEKTEKKVQREIDKSCKFKLLWRREMRNLHRENEFFRNFISNNIGSNLTYKEKEKLLLKIDKALLVFPDKNDIVEEERMLEILESCKTTNE